MHVNVIFKAGQKLLTRPINILTSVTQFFGLYMTQWHAGRNFDGFRALQSNKIWLN